MTGRPFIILALCLVSGCAGSQGFHPDLLRARLQFDQQRFVGAQPRQPIAMQPSGQTAGRMAPTLGLYLNPTGFLQHEFEWTDGDREALLAWAKGLSTKGVVADASFISQSSIKGNSLAELRASAARYGADLLLVVDGAAEVDRYNNYKAGLWYWTILGTYIADGTHSDALCLLRSRLWDVKTGTPLSDDDVQGKANQIGPAARIDDVVVISQARRQAFAQLLDRVKNRLALSKTP